MALRRPQQAALLSAVWPGLGQVWLGERARGAAMMALWGFLAVTMLLTFTLPFLIAAWAWMVYDAHATARRLEARADPPKEGPFLTCPGCGTALPADFRTCPECGAHLPALFEAGPG